MFDTIQFYSAFCISIAKLHNKSMLDLLIYSLGFLLAYMGFIKFLWVAMQDGQMFDMLFGFSKFRDYLYTKGNIGQLIEKALGGCEQCTSFWWAWIWCVPYYLKTDSSVFGTIAFGFICSFAGFLTLIYTRPKEQQ